MRRLAAIATCALVLAFAGVASAQTVTPAASQLLPCRAGAGPANSCGGLCAVGYQCVFVPENNDCSCQLDAAVCRTGTKTTAGYCAMKPNEIGGNCAPRGMIYRCE